MANLDSPLCFLLGLNSLYCSCSFRPPNLRLVSVAEEMEVGSHMEVLFLEQTSRGSSHQAGRAFCLPITALCPVVSSWACLSLATSGCLIIYNNIFKQSCLWVCSCRAWRQCGLVIRDWGPRVGAFFSDDGEVYAMELGSLGLFQSHTQQLWGVHAGSFVMGIMEVKGVRCFTHIPYECV